MVTDITDRLRAISKVVYEVTQYGNLSNGWDGKGSKAPPAASIEVALEFLRAIPEWLSMPTPMVSGNGNLGFYWDRQSTYVDVEIDRSQQISTLIVCRKNSKKDKWIADELICCITPDWFTINLHGLKEEDVPLIQTPPVLTLVERNGASSTIDQYDGVDAEPVS
jgi:hypothetical protein